MTTLQSVRSSKRTHDQVDTLPVGALESLTCKKQKQETFQPHHVTQALSICPSCRGKLLKPSTLPCGYTVCQSCLTDAETVCVSPTCDRIHTITTHPNVTLQAMQAIVTSFEASHSIEALQNSFNMPTECPICCTRFTNPTTTPCGHTFCSNCLVRSLDHQRSCPFCRDTLDFCPPPTKLLYDILTQLYQQDDESMDEHSLNDFDSTDTRVPLLIGSLSFPHINCVIHVFEPRYRLMLRRIMASSRRRFAMCLARRKRTSPQQPPFFEYGTILELMNVQTLPDGRSIVQAVGSHRFKVLNFDLVDGYHMADIERIDDIDREQEHLLEQQQILKASTMRARQKQQSQPMMMNNPAATATATAARPMAARPMAARPMAARPMAARPMAARPMAARPMAARPTSAAAATAQPMMTQQRQSWAQQAHPQTQAPVSRAPWLQMHVRGLSAARPKAHVQPQQASPNTTLLPAEKAEKNRQEQSTDELLDELATFIDKLLLHRQQQQTGMANWMNALGDPPVLRGPGRDKVILSWWIVNMMPLGEDEKLPLLAMRTVRERVLVIISWVDKFQDQWSLFLNNGVASANTPTPNTCCIS